MTWPLQLSFHFHIWGSTCTNKNTKVRLKEFILFSKERAILHAPTCTNIHVVGKDYYILGYYSSNMAGFTTHIWKFVMLQETKYHWINQVCKDGQFVRGENTPLPGGDTVYSLIGVRILHGRGWKYSLIRGENTSLSGVRILPCRGWEYSLVGGENNPLSGVRILPRRGWKYSLIGGENSPSSGVRVLYHWRW